MQVLVSITLMFLSLHHIHVGGSNSKGLKLSTEGVPGKVELKNLNPLSCQEGAELDSERTISDDQINKPVKKDKSNNPSHALPKSVELDRSPSQVSTDPEHKKETGEPQSSGSTSIGQGEKIHSSFTWLLNKALHHIKGVLRYIREFFVGNGVLDPTGSEIQYGSIEKKERERIVKQIRGLTPEGEEPKDWLKGIDSRFENIHSITEIGDDDHDSNETIDILNSLVAILTNPVLRKRDKIAVLDAINHITRYNQLSKRAICTAADIYSDVFKALVVAISSVRADGSPSDAVKGSFEADWLAKPSVAERYNRILLVREQPVNLIPQVKDLARRLERVKDVTIWNTPHDIPDHQVQTIMEQALGFFTQGLDHDNIIYVQEIIQYICSLNTQAFQMLIQRLQAEEQYIEVIAQTWAMPMGPREESMKFREDLFESLPESAVEIRLLTDPTVGPALDRRLLHMSIPLYPVPRELEEIRSEIIEAGDLIMDKGLDPRLRYNPKNLLHRVMEAFSATAGDQHPDTTNHRSHYMELISYLQRWRPDLKYDIYREMETNEIFSNLILEFVSNGLYKHGSAIPQYSFYYRMLKGTRYEESCLRWRLLLKCVDDSTNLGVIYRNLKYLDPEWWTPIYSHSEPRELVSLIIEYLGSPTPKPKTDPEGRKAIEVLQHLCEFYPAFRDDIHVAVHAHTAFRLRSLLRFYMREELKQPDPNQPGPQKPKSPNGLAQWLSKIDILKTDEAPPESRLTRVKNLAGIAGSQLLAFTKLFGQLSLQSLWKLKKHVQTHRGVFNFERIGLVEG